jgi:Copper transport outer membrane protein, MctB
VSVLRRHIFPLFGAGTTLALGIALGAGPLQGDSGGDGTGSLTAANTRLSEELAAARGGATFGEALASAAAAGWLHAQLAGESVTLVVLPGVDADRTDAVRNAVRAAGGTVAVTAHIDGEVLDPGHKTYISSVAASSLDGAGKVDGARTPDPYAQLGALLGRAYVAAPDRLPFDDIATKIDSELQGAKLVTVDGQPEQRGSLVVVLGSGAHGSDIGVRASSLIASTLVRRLAAASRGAVLATPPTGVEPGGVIATLTDDGASRGHMSTLNVSSGTVADVATVYALAASARGKGGDFGVTGSETRLPPRLANHAG